jgi:hypothetical protein
MGLGNGNGGGETIDGENKLHDSHDGRTARETNNITEEFILYVLWVYYDIYRGFV